MNWLVLSGTTIKWLTSRLLWWYTFQLLSTCHGGEDVHQNQFLATPQTPGRNGDDTHKNDLLNQPNQNTFRIAVMSSKKGRMSRVNMATAVGKTPSPLLVKNEANLASVNLTYTT